MLIKARPLHLEEQILLTSEQCTDNLDAYIIERILKMSAKGWGIPDIAVALDLTESKVVQTIQIFNQKGLAPLLS